MFDDPLKIFHDPLAGRDPSVEKHWSKGAWDFAIYKIFQEK